MSIGEALKISGRQTSQDTHNVTFSQALAAGLTHYDWLTGPKTDLCGRDHVLASHLALLEKEKGDKISGTCGRLLDGLSKSASLQLSLENRLRESMDANGSPEYEMTWLSWDMPSGPPICRLRALAHRTSGKDYCGWRSPMAMESGISVGRLMTIDGEHWVPGKRAYDMKTGRLCQVGLNQESQILHGWPTARTVTGGAESWARKQELGRKKSGGSDLQAAAMGVTGWPTPETAKGGQTSRSGKRKKELLIGGIVRGFATPRASDDKRGTSLGPVMRGVQRKGAQNDLGTTVAMFRASTGNTEGYRLNPYFSLWLMGYPIEWGYLGARAIQLYRN